jgi:riboflavin kinase/FMN adenylyltransferase
MLLLRGFKSVSKVESLLIGSFDGFHLGHKALLEYAVPPIGVLTFYPNPKFVIRNLDIKKSLASLPVLIPYLRDLGVAQLNLVHFTKQFSQISAAHFFHLIKEHLNPNLIIVGEDARVGKGGEGTVPVMKNLFPNLIDVPHVLVDGKKIGSRWIRELIEAGDIKKANSLLGRPYTLRGNVRRGDGRGKGIGFPTANIHGIREVTPAKGVYVTETCIKNNWIRSVTNIGTRPTFNGEHVTVESHLINYPSPDFYNQRIFVRFLDRIRDERKFGTLNELVAQIKQDSEYATSFKI